MELQVSSIFLVCSVCFFALVGLGTVFGNLSLRSWLTFFRKTRDQQRFECDGNDTTWVILSVFLQQMQYGQQFINGLQKAPFIAMLFYKRIIFL